MESLLAYLSMHPTGHDVKNIKRGLDTVPGVRSVSVSQNGRVCVDFDETATSAPAIGRALLQIGYRTDLPELH